MHLSNPASDHALGLASLLLRQVKIEEFDEAIRRISTSQGIGPLIHPEAWMKSKAFKGTDLAIRTLQIVKDLRAILAEADRELQGVDNLLEVVGGTSGHRANCVVETAQPSVTASDLYQQLGKVLAAGYGGRKVFVMRTGLGDGLTHAEGLTLGAWYSEPFDGEIVWLR